MPNSLKRRYTITRSSLVSITDINAPLKGRIFGCSYQIMAEQLGADPNRLDQLFTDLARWEQVLTALPQPSVDSSPPQDESPGLRPD